MLKDKIKKWRSLTEEQKLADDHVKCPECEDQLCFCSCPALLAQEILEEIVDDNGEFSIENMDNFDIFWGEIFG